MNFVGGWVIVFTTGIQKNFVFTTVNYNTNFPCL